MSSADPRLGRRAHRAGPHLSLWSEVSLPLMRVHEFCGRARRTLALHAAAHMVSGGPMAGPVIWIAPGWGTEPLNPNGITGILPPQLLTFLSPRRPEDLLWCMEEVLRSGTVPVVVADLPEPPAMTPVRRLHLAAETGGREGRCQPLGILLTPGTGGAPGIETRYGLEPAHAAGRDAWHLTRLRARMAPPQSWRLENGRLAPLRGVSEDRQSVPAA